MSYAVQIPCVHFSAQKTQGALLSRNFSEQRKLRLHNGFRHLWYEIIVENFV